MQHKTDYERKSRLLRENDKKKNWRQSMLTTFLADSTQGGLALQYTTAILHMNHLFIKYRKCAVISKKLLDV